MMRENGSQGHWGCSISYQLVGLLPMSGQFDGGLWFDDLRLGGIMSIIPHDLPFSALGPALRQLEGKREREREREGRG